jgi:nitroimidazol reductase NimA-like FMN-containing flavoprotein (pyridoxamine 5'-phosphate oxidase superfamily)
LDKDFMTSAVKLSGPWSIQAIETFLAASIIPVRLSVLGSEGAPIVASHWFIHENGVIRCATQQGSVIYKCLQSNIKCGFEVSPDNAPYRGVRGQGTASLDLDENKAMLARLHDRYRGEKRSKFREWLLNRDAAEFIISVRPSRIMSWDYSTRMTAT